jgi:surface antigen
MRPRALPYVVALTLFAAVTSPAAADGLVNPFDSSGIALSKEDSELMRGALRSVLETKKAGTAADWKSSSGRAGRATSLDVFEQNGMACANVEHVFTAGGGTTYRLPFCETADGTWKIAF